MGFLLRQREWGCPFRGIPAPYQIFLFFAGEQFNMCTFTAEAGLFSSYTGLKVGGLFSMTQTSKLLTILALFICVVALQFLLRLTEQCLK